jgi:ATP-dependent DNA helicase RecG
MEALEILDRLNRGEDSLHQFKRTLTNPLSTAGEMVAFANTEGGQIFVGVADDGTITGLSSEDIRRLNQLVANVSTNNVNPPINVLTTNHRIDEKIIMVIQVPKGSNRPYCDSNGVYWVKSGADKRRITSQQELRRIFQAEGEVYADEQPIPGAGLDAIESQVLEDYVQAIFQKSVQELDLDLLQLLQNLKFATADSLNLTGLLILAKNPQQYRPQFNVKAVAYLGNELAGQQYRDREDINGRIPELYRDTLSFLKRNLRRVQGDQGFNSEGQLEIPEVVLEELLQNALVHRDYFISAPIRIFLFDDRLEIISPGVLPNSLTVSNILTGTAIQRNPTLASRAFRILPYTGLGSGIPRAVSLLPTIQFDNQLDAHQFVVRIPRTQD